MKIARFALGVSAAVLATTALGAVPAQAHSRSNGERSLVTVLTKDTSGFDRNNKDFDVLTAAVKAVLGAKPASPVKVLADGSVALTAFIPNDGAFRQLAKEASGATKLPTEQAAFGIVAGLGIDTVETVLLYHVVPGATITRKAALRSDGAALTTAAGPAITVDVVCKRSVSLIDADTNDRNPAVVGFDINKGNKQIAHAIDRVLRPIDLP